MSRLIERWRTADTRRRSGAVFAVVTLAACIAVAVWHMIDTGNEVAATVLSIPILIVTTLTLWTTWPQRARLVVLRAEELGYTDLIFFLANPDADPDGLKLPDSYLLQLFVAIANVGDTKAVLSRIKIDRFVNAADEAIVLPGGPTLIDGTRWVRRSGYQDGGKRLWENYSVFPPYVLAQGDVIMLQFRQRRGPTWGPQASLDDLRAFRDALRHPLARAEGFMLWRRGDQLLNSRFSVPLVVEQQEEFVAQLVAITKDFTVQPVTQQRRLVVDD